MNFLIQAKSYNTAEGYVTSEATTVLEAIKMATEFLAKGMSEVVVLDKSDGHAYSAPLQLPNLFQKYKKPIT